MEASFEYNFAHARRGVALIICNGEFMVGDAKNRPAAKRDEELLRQTCRTLGFAEQDIRVHPNLTSIEMIKTTRKGRPQWEARVTIICVTERLHTIDV